MKVASPNVKLLAGQSFSVFCSAITGSKPLKFDWFRDSISISESNYKIQLFDESTSGLKISAVGINDAANYTCKVSNVFGSDSISTLLSIKSKTEFIKMRFKIDITLLNFSRSCMDC